MFKLKVTIENGSVARSNVTGIHSGDFVSSVVPAHSDSPFGKGFIIKTELGDTIFVHEITRVPNSFLTIGEFAKRVENLGFHRQRFGYWKHFHYEVKITPTQVRAAKEGQRFCLLCAGREDMTIEDKLLFAVDYAARPASSILDRIASSAAAGHL